MYSFNAKIKKISLLLFFLTAGGSFEVNAGCNARTRTALSKNIFEYSYQDGSKSQRKDPRSEPRIRLGGTSVWSMQESFQWSKTFYNDKIPFVVIERNLKYSKTILSLKFDNIYCNLKNGDALLVGDGLNFHWTNVFDVTNTHIAIIDRNPNEFMFYKDNNLLFIKPEKIENFEANTILWFSRLDFKRFFEAAIFMESFEYMQKYLKDTGEIEENYRAIFETAASVGAGKNAVDAFKFFKSNSNHPELLPIDIGWYMQASMIRLVMSHPKLFANIFDPYFLEKNGTDISKIAVEREIFFNLMTKQSIKIEFFSDLEIYDDTDVKYFLKLYLKILNTKNMKDVFYIINEMEDAMLKLANIENMDDFIFSDYGIEDDSKVMKVFFVYKKAIEASIDLLNKNTIKFLRKFFISRLYYVNIFYPNKYDGIETDCREMKSWKKITRGNRLNKLDVAQIMKSMPTDCK